MNGVGSNTRVVVIIPSRQVAITTLKIVAAVLTALALAGTVACWVIRFLNKRKA